MLWAEMEANRRAKRAWKSVLITRRRAWNALGVASRRRTEKQKNYITGA